MEAFPYIKYIIIIIYFYFIIHRGFIKLQNKRLSKNLKKFELFFKNVFLYFFQLYQNKIQDAGKHTVCGPSAQRWRVMIKDTINTYLDF